MKLDVESWAEKCDVLVSTNEQVTNPDLVQLIQKRLRISLFPLPVGDYLVIGNPNVIIERKKVGDHLASQRDNRAYNQKKELEMVEGAIPIIMIHGHYKQVAGHTKRWKPRQVCGVIATQIFETIQHLAVPDDEWFADTLWSIHNMVTKEYEWKPRPITFHPRQTKNEDWALNIFQSVDKVGPVAAYKLATQFDTVAKAFGASRELLQQTIGDVTGARMHTIINTPLDEYCKKKRSKQKP